jgi:hypothetical protein
MHEVFARYTPGSQSAVLGIGEPISFHESVLNPRNHGESCVVVCIARHIGCVFVLILSDASRCGSVRRINTCVTNRDTATDQLPNYAVPKPVMRMSTATPKCVKSIDVLSHMSLLLMVLFRLSR